VVEYRDERTGVKVQNLTSGLKRAVTFYHTHPMWTQEMELLVFNAQQSGSHADPRLVPHALHLKAGHVRTILDREVAASVLDAATGRLYYVDDNAVCAISVGLAFRRMAASRKVAALPANVKGIEGGLSLDSKKDFLYLGALLEEGAKWGILALNIASGQWKTVAELDFRIGHIQANPSIARIIMFCHETGRDAPQRMWLISANGVGPRPFYKETYDEWVTHEIWWGGVRAAFTIWPYDDEHKKRPHGVLSADVATGRPVVHSQFPAWHTCGSPDGKWLVADDFERNIWLIRADDGQRRLLTQGHLDKGHDTHPHPSFTPDNKAVVFNSSRGGIESILMAEMPEDWDSLPLP
jgi:oligogalacturonide lyase